MAIIRGQREAKGITAAELNPIEADIAKSLRQQVKEFREFRKNAEAKPVSNGNKPLSRQVSRLTDLNQVLSKKIQTLKTPPAPQVVQVASSVPVVKQMAPGRKMAQEDVSYQKSGPYPFICGQCVHLQPGNYCGLVKGPYKDGRIGLEDTCQLHQSNLPIGKAKS